MLRHHWTIPHGMRLVYAGGHCHAPSCLSIELYENSSGTPKLLCRQLPYYGQGHFPQDELVPVYRHTGWSNIHFHDEGHLCTWKQGGPVDPFSKKSECLTSKSAR